MKCTEALCSGGRRARGLLKQKGLEMKRGEEGPAGREKWFHISTTPVYMRPSQEFSGLLNCRLLLSHSVNSRTGKDSPLCRRCAAFPFKRCGDNPVVDSFAIHVCYRCIRGDVSQTAFCLLCRVRIWSHFKDSQEHPRKISNTASTFTPSLLLFSKNRCFTVSGELKWTVNMFS